MDTEAFLKARSAQVDRALEDYVSSWDDVPAGLLEAIRYCLFATGKRMRPALVLEAAEICGGKIEDAMPAACAIEMIHTYSLVHDDLPAMDDDDLRRGKPTVHKAFNEATAILTGDALLTMAFDMAAKTGNARVVKKIARAAGVWGMVGGQYIDLQSEGMKLGLDALQHLHKCKTGALIKVSLDCGAILGGGTDAQVSALKGYGSGIGLAFQIADDLLDVTGDEAKTGKPIGSDAGHDKSTYPALLGLDEAKRMAKEVADAAVEQLSDFGEKAANLRALARYIVERDH